MIFYDVSYARIRESSLSGNDFVSLARDTAGIYSTFDLQLTMLRDLLRKSDSGAILN